MARASKGSEPAPDQKPRLLKAKSETAQLIQQQTDEGERLLAELQTPIDLEEFTGRRRNWSQYTCHLLKTLFTTDSVSKEFGDPYGMTLDPYRELYLQNEEHYVKARIQMLKSIRMRINLFELAPPEPEPATSSGLIQSAGLARDVFVVHGHEVGPKESVARFLEKIGLNPIILHEQPDMGRTIIEKFLDHSHVDFAIVLMTGDDVGSAKDSADLRPRARQNVILELGYFVGRLGRDHVCALVSEGVEVPSDLLGVLHKKLDVNGAWKWELAKEIDAAGIEIDFNLVKKA